MITRAIHRVTILFCILFFSLCQVCFANPIPSRAFVSWMKHEMQYYQVPIVSMVVMRDYKIEWMMVFVNPAIFPEHPITDATLFQAGSISKPVTAVAALKAVQDNKLSLDTDINQTLTSWQVPTNELAQEHKVTLRGLLSHSAGINVASFFGYANGHPTPTLIDVLNGKPPANSAPIQVVRLPGEQYAYSGGGYTIVQQALQDTYQESFADIMNELVLQPLGMAHSTFNQPIPAGLVDQIAPPYRYRYAILRGGPHTYVEQAAAGLWTTPFDLAKFTISIQESLKGDTNQILSPRYARLLMKPVHDQMGLGFFVNVNKFGEPAKNGGYFMHPGQNEGYRNFLIGSMKGGNGAIIMTDMSPNGRLVMSGKIKDNWDFMNAIVERVAVMEKWE